MPPIDPLADTGSSGLRMFNLGTIPASVTPPRSWRRAAWFTVLASAAALVGLLVLGALLVGPARHTGRFAALPYFPNGHPLASIGGPNGTPDRDHISPRSNVIAHPVTDEVADATIAPRMPVRSGPHRTPTRRPAPGSATAPSAVGTLPDTISTTGEPVVDPTKLIHRTRTYFNEVTSNAKAAADLTTGTLRDDATALIHQKYGDISSIQIQSISLNPTTGLTISVLRLVHKDGTTQTQRTTLQFTLTGDPKITNPGG